MAENFSGSVRGQISDFRTACNSGFTSRTESVRVEHWDDRARVRFDVEDDGPDGWVVVTTSSALYDDGGESFSESASRTYATPDEANKAAAEMLAGMKHDMAYWEKRSAFESRVFYAEQRLGITLPQAWKEWAFRVPGYADGDKHCSVLSFDGDLLSTGPLLQPEDLFPLSHPRWNYESTHWGREPGAKSCWAFSGIDGDARDRIIPFIEDGAGNAYGLFYDGGGEPKVIDLDHETTAMDASIDADFIDWIEAKKEYGPFLAGSTFAFAGEIRSEEGGMSLEEAKAIAREFGAEIIETWRGSVRILGADSFEYSPGATFFVAGVGAEDEAEEAREEGVWVLDAETWLDLTEQR